MKIPNQAYLDDANHGFAVGVRTAVAALLYELDSRGVQFNDDFTMSDLALEVQTARTGFLLDEGALNG